MDPVTPAANAEHARRRRRRSIAIGLLLAGLVVLFYLMAVLHGPSIVNRPL